MVGLLIESIIVVPVSKDSGTNSPRPQWNCKYQHILNSA